MAIYIQRIYGLTHDQGAVKATSDLLSRLARVKLADLQDAADRGIDVESWEAAKKDFLKKTTFDWAMHKNMTQVLIEYSHADRKITFLTDNGLDGEATAFDFKGEIDKSIEVVPEADDHSEATVVNDEPRSEIDQALDDVGKNPLWSPPEEKVAPKSRFFNKPSTQKGNSDTPDIEMTEIRPK